MFDFRILKFLNFPYLYCNLNKVIYKFALYFVTL